MFPVPQVLLDYGFASYVERLKDTGQPYLFPLFFNEKYPFGKEASRQFNRLIRTKRVGVLDRKVTFHSFRHTLINALRDSGADDKTISDISGHTTEATDDVLHRTYLKPDRAGKLKEALDRVCYEGLNILNPYKDAPGVVKRWQAKEREWLKKNKGRLEV
jgi:integrase